VGGDAGARAGGGTDEEEEEAEEDLSDGDFEDDPAAMVLAGYRTLPDDPDGMFLDIARRLAVSRILEVQNRPWNRRPWLRLLVDADNVRVALRDDVLVRMIFTDEDEL
jgi:hypothetical protein